MAGKRARAPRKNESWDGASCVDQAYGAALAFLNELSELASSARQWPPSALRNEWKQLGIIFGGAFVAWLDLTVMLKRDMRNRVAEAYPPGSPSIRIGIGKPKATVIEAVADELGAFFRDVLYFRRLSPLEPDVEVACKGAPILPGPERDKWIEAAMKSARLELRQKHKIECYFDAVLLYSKEWQRQNRSEALGRIRALTCEGVDFDDLRVQLDREARALLREDGRRKSLSKAESKLRAKRRTGGKALAVDEPTMAMLRRMAKSPTLRFTVPQLQSVPGAPQDLRTIRKKLTSAAELGLIDYQADDRCGAAILQPGIAFVAKPMS